MRALLSSLMARDNGAIFAALMALTLVIRIAANHILALPMVSDSVAYYDLASSMAAGQLPADNFGKHAFYSIGYSLFLTPFFALLGASAKVGFAVNLLLALISALLVRALARALKLPVWARLLAVAGHAIWLAGIWNCVVLSRENLSTPLLLAVALMALRILAHGPRAGLAMLTGAIFGAALLTGTSALPIILAPLMALAFAAKWRIGKMAAPILALMAGMALVVAPWMMATHAMLGRAVLTSNSGFNLYLGNNPAADGRFVSIAKTPAATDWRMLNDTIGEAGASAELGHRALNYMVQNPTRTAQLTATKLALFWAPNLPSANDFTANRKVAIIRLGEVAEYCAFLILGLLALLLNTAPLYSRLTLAALIAGFWGLHGIAYIIARYRDPVMPLLIVLSCATISYFFTRYTPHKEPSHAA